MWVVSFVLMRAHKETRFVWVLSVLWKADASELISSWPSKFSKEKLILTRLDSSTAHPELVYEGTRTDYCKDQAVFDEGAVPFLSVW